MMDEDIRETVIAREKIFEGKVLNVQKWTVTLPDGNKSFREIALHRGASAVVPVDAEGNVYLVKQFRTAFEDVLTEIPAGKLDYIGEDRFEAAKRELKEETGYTAEKWTHLTDLATTPGFTNELISIYLAEGLSNGETAFDDDEFIRLEKLPLKTALKYACDGTYKDSKTIVGLLLAGKILLGE